MIVGTAGHIDHGKTALVAALTGIDTDRLPEEKRRGITLELGFAHLTLPDGRRLGVVDVPGHERFVKAMVAGAGGIDLALLVVAVDEGVMPQTREHLDICRLLGIQKGLIALTKSDLLPTLGDEWLPLIRADLASLVEGTFLEDAPVLLCSAQTGEGLTPLVQTLAKLADEVPARPADGPLLLPIDRAFSLKGFGTVVTGPLLSGSLTAEDEVELLPKSAALPGPLRVRGVQVHGAAVKKASAGDRTAVNLAHLEAASVTRGLTLVRQGEIPESHILDVEVSALPALEAPLQKRRKLLLHVGTAQAEATLALLDRDNLGPGETGVGQLRLSSPLAALPDQHFILRGSRALKGRGATLAGGRILGIAAPKRRRAQAPLLTALSTLPREEPSGRILWHVAASGSQGRTQAELFVHTGAQRKPLQRALELLSSRGELVLVDKDKRLYVHRDTLASLTQKALAHLEAFHARAPLEEGLSVEALRTTLAQDLEPRLFQKVLLALTSGPSAPARLERERIRLEGRSPSLSQDESSARAALLEAIDVGSLAPPTVGELAAVLAMKPARVVELLKTAQGEGRVHRVSEELYFSSRALGELRARLVSHLEAHGSITTQQFKELVGQTRKFVIPLSEYFDREKVTLRVGEKRQLRRA